MAHLRKQYFLRDRGRRTKLKRITVNHNTRPTTMPCYHCLRFMAKHCPKTEVAYKIDGVWETKTVKRIYEDHALRIAVSSAKAPYKRRNRGARSK